jgi:hypothetical protein
MDATEPTRQLVRLRGRSYVAFVFSPVVPVMEWLADIDTTLARSPGFFVGKPVVLDLSSLDLSTSAIAHLIVSLEKKNIRVLGVEGVEPGVWSRRDVARLGAEERGCHHDLVAEHEVIDDGVMAVELRERPREVVGVDAVGEDHVTLGARRHAPRLLVDLGDGQRRAASVRRRDVLDVAREVAAAKL